MDLNSSFIRMFDPPLASNRLSAFKGGDQTGHENIVRNIQRIYI